MKVEKTTHRKIKATVVSPEASHVVEGPSAGHNQATTTTNQEAPTDAQRSTAGAASQTSTATTTTKVYQKQAAKKQKGATSGILQATKPKSQATTVSMHVAVTPKQPIESAAKNPVVIGQDKLGGKGSAARQSKDKVFAEETQAAPTRQQSREPTATHQLGNAQDKLQGKATVGLKEGTPALSQATSEPDVPQSTHKPPLVPTKQACSEQRKQLSFEDIRGINELLEKCVSLGSMPPLVRSKSAGTIPIIRASPDLNLAASKEAIDSVEAPPSLQRSKSRSAVWDDYCPALTFNLGIDEMLENKGVEGNAAEDKGVTKDNGVADAPPTSDIEWGINWGNLDFDQVIEGAVKSAAADGAGCMSPSRFSTPTEDAKNTDEGESSKGVASSSGEPVPQKRERRILKAPPSQRSPYVNVDAKKDFTCTPEVNRLYALVLLHGGTGTTRTSQGDDKACVFLE